MGKNDGVGCIKAKKYGSLTENSDENYKNQKTQKCASCFKILKLSRFFRIIST